MKSISGSLSPFTCSHNALYSFGESVYGAFTNMAWPQMVSITSVCIVERSGWKRSGAKEMSAIRYQVVIVSARYGDICIRIPKTIYQDAKETLFYRDKHLRAV
ncbi:Hypothetical_protein [Hexamita inflata]|uniref:Hypothetical_protein n=1 Tax=Hexamita inflata TaxID=28002 RepID=A0AA86NKA9_9EUKA|nr:Hypothetical protein HINF_LOCUS8181 [Hexamita inflata]